MASGNPEPTIEFYLPDLNVTVNETDGQYNFFSHTDGHTTTGMIKLREKGEREDNGPAVNVHCSVFNMYGRDSLQLDLQQESESLCLFWSKKTPFLCKVYILISNLFSNKKILKLHKQYQQRCKLLSGWLDQT